jgi:hypothetical protein
MAEYTISLSDYEISWIEQAKNREAMGYSIDDGTLITIGSILIDKLRI